MKELIFHAQIKKYIYRYKARIEGIFNRYKTKAIKGNQVGHNKEYG